MARQHAAATKLDTCVISRSASRAKITYSSVSPDKSIGQWVTDIKANGLKNLPFFGFDLLSGVGIVANINKVIKAWWNPFVSV